MKKFITIAVATAILAAATVTAILANRNTDPIFQANIEALMNNEGDRGTGTCYNTVTYLENVTVLYCGGCHFVWGIPLTTDTGICY